MLIPVLDFGGVLGILNPNRMECLYRFGRSG